MYEILELGPVPCDEPCEQLGDGYDAVKAKDECKRYLSALRSVYGEEPEGAKLIVKNMAHDFGNYYEVCVKFDPDNDAASEYAYKCESGLDKWPTL